MTSITTAAEPPARALRPASPYADLVRRNALAEVALRAELLSRKLEVVRITAPHGDDREVQRVEKLLMLVARQISELIPPATQT